MTYMLLVFPVMIGWVIWNYMRHEKTKAQHGDKALAHVAQRLGLSIVEGDPSINLLYFEPPGSDYERQIILRGSPYGRATEFWVRDWKKTSEYVVATKVTTSFSSCFRVDVPAAPVFEVLLRNPNKYMTVEREHGDLALAAVSAGDAMLDALFVIWAEDPSVGPALSPALRLLASHHYVHLAGGSGQIWIKIERLGLGYVATSAEEYLLILETAACGLEGKQAPAAAPLAMSPAA